MNSLTGLPTLRTINMYFSTPCGLVIFHSLIESRSIRMYFCVLFALFIMAGFFDDDECLSLSGLTQEGHEVDVTVISDSEESLDNFAGLLECAKALETGKKSGETSKLEDSMLVTEQVAEVNRAEGWPEGAGLELPSSGLNVSNKMASSMGDQKKDIHVSFIKICPLQVG